MPRIRLDVSVSVVALCECGWRGQVAASRAEAWAAAGRHVKAAHPQDRQALAASRKRLSRLNGASS